MQCGEERWGIGAVCCSECVAALCSALQCVAVCCSVLQCVAALCSVLQCVAVCCSVLQCVAVCCSVAVLCAQVVYCRDAHTLQEAWLGCLQQERKASLHCFNLPFSQLLEVKFVILPSVPEKTGWMRKASLYWIFPVNRPLSYQAVWDVPKHETCSSTVLGT